MADELNGAIRVAGCDLGKSAAKFVIASVSGDGVLKIESTQETEHDGRPVEVFEDWYRSNEIHACAALGATGVYSDRLNAPVMTGLPEDACLAAALDHIPEIDGPVNVVSIGARGYGALARNEHGDIQFVENDKCSSGTGETMVRIAGRFGMSIEEADAAAKGTDDSIPITARCSVFAKSEMTHFGNQGKPAPALFKGYFGSIAKYVAALLARAQVDGPVVAVGGCSRIETIVDALGEHAGQEVVVPELALFAEALGAASLAGEQAFGQRLDALPVDTAGLIKEMRTRFVTLEPSSGSQGSVTRLEERPVPEGAAEKPSVLGIDLGSTGSKIVLTDLETGEAVLDLYDRTRGNPVDAAQRLIASLLEEFKPDVRAIALTGSGREAAATVLRAAYPEFADRVLTLNEIVAHATAAIRCDDRGGESLSIVEIGGQDAKFIQVLGGKIVESDMNKACSAGTGSFLEEQALFYGVDEISDFTKLAMTAERPPDLGQMCTVFVAEAAAEARNEGYEIADLFSGFEHSVIHNYINRVMGQRAFGQRIFFQGKPATAESLAWTLASITGREVFVPPNPGAMGAWGIGLCAIDELGSDRLIDEAAFELSQALSAEVVERSEFQCKDKRCATLCSIERTKVAVLGQEQTVLSGGSCPRYEVASAAKNKLPIEAPSAFDEREALLEETVAKYAGGAEAASDDRPELGIPAIGACVGWVPWLATFTYYLGFKPVIMQPDAKTLSRGEERCYSYDACAPVKVGHGAIDGDVDKVFFPKILSVNDRDDCAGKTCAMEQALPEMIREALHARGREIEIVSPLLSLEDEINTLRVRDELFEIARRLGSKRTRLHQIAEARRMAKEAQREFEAGLAEIGERTLGWGREYGVPVVPVCGPLHVIHDPAVSAGIPRLLRENGALALPMECFPIDNEEVPELERVPWGDALRALRVGIASRMRGDAYPLLLSSFGCGPNSFVEQLFAAVLEGHPHTTLESDGHGGTAGYTTRVQAFLYAVSRHDGEPSEVQPERLKIFNELPNPPAAKDKDDPSKKYVIFSFADWFSPMIAASYRSQGVDAVAAGPNNSDSLQYGRSDCSGKECLPYQLMWGSFRRHIEDEKANGNEDQSSVFVQVTGEGACRNCMFSIKDQLSLERLGVSDSVVMRDLQIEPSLGISFAHRLVTSITAWDILFSLVSYHRALEIEPGEVDAIYTEFCEELERITEKRPNENTIGGVVGLLDNSKEVFKLLERASTAFAEIGERAKGREDLRTVLLSGDIYLRLDEFAGDNIIRRLNERGVLVAVEPALTFSSYMAYEQVRELTRIPQGGRQGGMVSDAITFLRRSLYQRVRKEHPWMPTGDTEPIAGESLKVLERYPIGEAPVTIGSVMLHWKEKMCDGAVLVSPWGCGPALVAESMLKHQRQIPILFIYGDGSPIDERRLNGFVFKLKRSEARVDRSALADAKI